METNIHSSFIPQEASQAPRPRRSNGGMFDLFGLIAIVLFVASATLAAGVFLYVEFLSSSAKSKVESLERAKDQFDPGLIQKMTRLDDRMRAADQVLGSHIAPSALFDLLEKMTLQSVSFTNLDFSISAVNEITLTMQGVAQSVNSIAYQADLLANSGAISSPIFSNINRQQGGVRFDFEAILNPTVVRYRDIINGVSEQPAGADAAQPAPLEEQAPPSGFEPPPATQSQEAPQQ